MHQSQKRLSLIGVIALGLMGITGFSPAWAEYQVGDTVGNFTLTNWNGQPVSLYDYIDRVVIINFWYTT